MITDIAGLHRFFDVSRDIPRIALDTEADSLHCYFEKLCLIQIATPDYSELLDPLADVPLTLFFQSLEGKEVVFHGADYDLRLLNRHGDFRPAKIFDTMLAARLAGEGQVGLAALVKKYFGVELSKASQKANWALRPLSQQMITYALSDVHFLLELSDRLKENLERDGRMEWLEEWIERMVFSARNPKEKDPEQRWRITGSSKLSPREQAVLRAIWLWRDEESQKWDRPPFYVMGNSDIIRIAECSVAAKPFSTPRFPKARRESFEAALEAALALPEAEWPVTERKPRPKPDPHFSSRFDRLKNRRDALAQKLGLEASILAPKAALEAIAADEKSDALMRWQRDLLSLPPL